MAGPQVLVPAHPGSLVGNRIGSVAAGTLPYRIIPVWGQLPYGMPVESQCWHPKYLFLPISLIPFCVSNLIYAMFAAVSRIEGGKYMNVIWQDGRHVINMAVIPFHN